MRLKARAQFTYRGVDVSAGDIFDMPEPQSLVLIDRNQAVPFNLEDPSQRAVGVIAAGIPDVPPVTINPTSANVATTGSTGNFSVTITGYGTSRNWMPTKDATADWITINSPTTPQYADGDVDYTVAPNAGAQRAANIYVNGKTFAITQDAVIGARGGR
jgi:hypothetical protein